MATIWQCIYNGELVILVVKVYERCIRIVSFAEYNEPHAKNCLPEQICGKLKGNKYGKLEELQVHVEHGGENEGDG